MKTFLIQIALTLFILSISTSTIKAQWSAPSIIRTPYGIATIPGQYYGGNMFFSNNKPVNKKYVYTIVLLNDSIINVKTKLKIDFKKSHTTISWKEGKGDQQKINTITPNETKQIYRTTLDDEKIIGIASDSTWLFLVGEKKIRTYSINSDIKFPIIAGIQLGTEGQIRTLNKENLHAMVGDNDPTLTKIINKNNLLKDIDYFNKKAKNAN